MSAQNIKEDTFNDSKDLPVDPLHMSLEEALIQENEEGLMTEEGLELGQRSDSFKLNFKDIK